MKKLHLGKDYVLHSKKVIETVEIEILAKINFYN